MTKKIKITVIGSVNADMVIHSPRRPVMGESVIGSGFFVSPGGKGANQAVACAKMGAETLFIGAVGNDAFGATMVDSLRSNGVITKRVKTSRLNTGVAVITVVGGDNFIVTDAGANADVTVDDINAYEDGLALSDAVLLQFEIPMSTNIEVIKKLKGKTKLFINPAPAAAIDADLLKGVDYFTPNETEAPVYTGIKINNIDDAFKSVDKLLEMGVIYPVVTLGNKGVAYFNGSGIVHKEAFNVRAVDTTAAGDTFAGALAFMAASGNGLDDAVYFAQAAAALSVMKNGAQASIPSHDEVEHFINAL